MKEIFKNPNISLVDIAKVLEVAEHRRTTAKNVDVRTVSKFKSIGLKKIRQELQNLADALRLDLSLQGLSKEEREEEKARNETLLRNGIMVGFDFRDDREVYLFYSIKDRSIVPWQAHTCNRKCEKECTKILNTIRSEHGLDSPKNIEDIKNNFIKSLDEIYERSKED